MNGSHRVLGGSERLVYDMSHLLNPDGDVKWISLVIIGVLAAVWNQLNAIEGLKRVVTLFAGVTVSFYLYPVFSGQFWRYHYLPFWAFCSVTLSAGLVPLLKYPRQRIRSYGAVSATCLVFAYFSYGALQTFRGSVQLPTQRTALQVEAYLSMHLQPTDTVQPLDWTGGMVEGMMRAHAHLATSFIYDFPLYHSVSTPYIRGLRQRLLSELNLSRPTYILERLGEDKPWPLGEDTTREFPELRKFIDQNYDMEVHSKDFNIWKWKGHK